MAQPKEKTRKQRLKDLERSLNPDGDLSPKAVLALQMQWFHGESEKTCSELITKLQSQNVRAEVYLKLWSDLLQLRRDACDTAAKLIKFVSPAMESVSVKQETTHRFVISAPTPIDDVNVWLKKCESDSKSRAVKTDLDIDQMLVDAKTKSVPRLIPIEDIDDENPLKDIPE
jgi:hypothetical protein